MEKGQRLNVSQRLREALRTKEGIEFFFYFNQHTTIRYQSFDQLSIISNLLCDSEHILSEERMAILDHELSEGFEREKKGLQLAGLIEKTKNSDQEKAISKAQALSRIPLLTSVIVIAVVFLFTGFLMRELRVQGVRTFLIIASFVGMFLFVGKQMVEVFQVQAQLKKELEKNK